MSYAEFLTRKSQSATDAGFEPQWLPAAMFPFQSALTEWALRKGRGAIFSDCGTGKSFMQLAWAENVRRQTNKPVLILTPLAVGAQTVQEGARFGIECVRSRDGSLSSGITVTNYEKLHLFSPATLGGVVCDESSILKHFRGATQREVTQFMRAVPYRLLCTATAAPNDYAELGCSSEALGVLGQVDMLGRFFKQEAQEHRLHQMKHRATDAAKPIAGTGGAWRLKGHAETPFWRWVSSWARAMRKPSDLGFSDDGFGLPELNERVHIITPERPRDGMLFTVPAIGLNEEREERRRTLRQRCEFVAQLVNHTDPVVVWCHLNSEGDLLETLIPGSTQVQGSDSDEAKEDAYRRFASGDLRVLIIKPKIGAWGLNWQHCNHVVTFASHSYEQFYQSVRRCWRYGQTRPVTVDIIATEGEKHVSENMARKARQADQMFARLVTHMHDGLALARRVSGDGEQERIPAWL